MLKAQPEGKHQLLKKSDRGIDKDTCKCVTSGKVPSQ